MNESKKTRRFVECGCCGCYHLHDYWGDCRDDKNRFSLDDIPDNDDIIFLQDEDMEDIGNE